MNTSFESPGRSFGDPLDAYDEASFIEMDPQLSSSKRLFKGSQDFDFPISEAPMGLVDADELILNGFIVPVFVNQVKADAYDDPAPSCASASSSSKKLHSVSDSGNRTRGSSLKKCQKLSKQIFLKYLDFLKPLCQRVRERRSGSRVGTFTARLHGERNWDCSASTSTRVRVANSSDNWRRSCDSESSIYEAVLHCKRTIGRSFGDPLDAYDEASFIEMDPQLSSSKRLFKGSQDFDFPISEAPMGLVDADELILNGFIVPVFVNQVKADAYDDPAPSCASASSSSKKLHSVSDSGNRTRGSSLKKCQKLSKQIFLKYLDFLKPLCQRVRERRSGSRVGTFTARLHGERNWDCSASTSTRVRVANSSDNWRRSCDSESSIYEAVLHCKRTIGD
ncbi:hypothetical protein ACET3Z_009026 [Daucus carota]